MSATVSVVIVNFRTPDLTLEAARSALGQAETLEVVIVDNASGDDGVARLKAAFSGQVRVAVVEATENRGFGAGNNLGVGRASGEFVFLLNSDAKLHPGALGALLGAWKDGDGVLAPAVFLADGKTLQADACGMFPTVWRLLTRQTKKAVESLAPDWVSGCAMLLRKADFQAIGGFDERLFMYMEDVLLCWRLRQKGLAVRRVLEAGVTHLGGGSMAMGVDKKAMYYAAQDLVLREMGVGRLGLLVVRALRWPNWLLGKLLGR